MSRGIVIERPKMELAVDENDIPIIGRRQKLNVAISIPSHDIVPMKFTYALAGMLATTIATFNEGDLGTASLNMVEGTYIHTMRQELIEEALRQGCSHILWCDSDHTFPRDALLKLLARNKRVVGINYSTRRIPADFVAITDSATNTRCWTTDESTGLEQVEAVGYGLLLMQMNVVDELGDRPWFQNYWDYAKGDWVGEDVHFCRLIGKAGIPIYVDHDLSKECSHVGTLKYELSHAYEFQMERKRHEEEKANEFEHGSVHNELRYPADGGERVVGESGPGVLDTDVHSVGGEEATPRPQDAGAGDDHAVDQCGGDVSPE